MTVAELIKKLKQYPLDAPVVSEGFDECDLDDIVGCALIPVYRNVREPGHCGEHVYERDANEHQAQRGKLVNCVYVGTGAMYYLKENADLNAN